MNIQQILDSIRLVSNEDVERIPTDSLHIGRVIAQEFVDMFTREMKDREPPSLKPMFTWDEICGEITAWAGADDLMKMDEQSKEAGFVFDRMLPNGVEVWKTDRHFGMNVTADSAEEAHKKFMEFPYYAKWQEGNKE